MYYPCLQLRGRTADDGSVFFSLDFVEAPGWVAGMRAFSSRSQALQVGLDEATARRLPLFEIRESTGRERLLFDPHDRSGVCSPAAKSTEV
jgi:hypothetical protein